MIQQGAPLRFVATMLALWGAGRAFWLMGEPVIAPAAASRPTPVSENEAASSFTSVALQWLPSFPQKTERGPQLTVALPPAAPAQAPTMSAPPIVLAMAPARDQPEILTPTAPSPAPRLDLDQAVRSVSRWSGSAWVYAREGSGARSLAALGQLGGSQAGARLRWRLNPSDQLRTALYGRVSGPLEDASGAEAAFGVEWHPLPGQPVWIAAERRVALGKQGRNAWSAYAAGGIWKPGLPMGFTLDGYAQAGVVGAKRRDLFADGALRVSRPLASPKGPQLGAGVWGAAQPGVARVDVGPHARLPLSVAKQPFSISADYRIRVAGAAAPGSGVAVTLASDF
jgi:hypothetical protein